MRNEQEGNARENESDVPGGLLVELLAIHGTRQESKDLASFCAYSSDPMAMCSGRLLRRAVLSACSKREGGGLVQHWAQDSGGRHQHQPIDNTVLRCLAGARHL